jgi:hypothetical protein
MDPSEVPKDLRAEFRLPSGPTGGGFLTVRLGDIRITAEYTPAKVELLRVLNQALLDDADLPALARGWRSPEQIAEQLSYPPTTGGIRRTVMLINRIFRNAAARGAPHLDLPPLVAGRRQIGIRLSWPIAFEQPGWW